MSSLQQDEPASGPLRGIRVIDFTMATAGPLATMLVAVGADVIEVETPHVPSPSR